MMNRKDVAGRRSLRRRVEWPHLRFSLPLIVSAVLTLAGCAASTKVVRNEHISKSDAKVVRIEPDNSKVYVEIKEDLGNGKFRTVERVLELHAGEPVTEGNP